MATVTITPAAGSSNYPDRNEANPIYFKIKRIDMAEAYAKKGSDLASGDVIESMTMSAGEHVIGAYAKIVTACSAAMTATIGDGTDPDGLITSVSLNGTANTITSTPGAYLQSGTTPFAVTQGKCYATADTIDLVLGGTAANNGVVDLVVICFNWNV